MLRKILAVDDSALIHQMYKLFLSRYKSCKLVSAMNGLEAAQALAEDWPDDGAPFPLVVFVSAYDQYALQAFDRAAFDYVLKPVETARLAQTCVRLRSALAARSHAAGVPTVTGSSAAGTPATGLAAAVEQLRTLLATSAAASAPVEPLRVIQAGVGNAIHMVPIDEVVYFEAADKYIRVLTAQREYLIRVALRERVPITVRRAAREPIGAAASRWPILRGASRTRRLPERTIR